MVQMQLFDDATAKHETPVGVEKKRLSKQCVVILEMLRNGVVSNVDLSGVALKYTSRISDLRAAGYTIDVVDRNRKTGVVWYELTGEPK